MSLVAVLIAQMLDPVRVLAVWLLMWTVGGWKGALVGVLASAVVAEIVLVAVSTSREFGQGLHTGLVASVLLAAIGFGLRGIYLRLRQR